MDECSNVPASCRRQARLRSSAHDRRQLPGHLQLLYCIGSLISPKDAVAPVDRVSFPSSVWLGMPPWLASFHSVKRSDTFGQGGALVRRESAAAGEEAGEGETAPRAGCNKTN
ncbi:uncharacterized protein LOC144820169 [Lissotriton helveticus]